ncbi:hypothetical protein [Mesorhizobium sp.]|uniref:hypothetical protein n=1 Tax=Mesorhizobium sp. TaxID=1871066 RepID=UPI000FE7FDCC|nr:hypothetical protein [Mesorhizobium sp.]RWD47450.1 MAG: hypothetical protein EOS35_06300 [Mesorhizobium sp.]TIU07284.1 MAG: hypothetical protein E5W39_07045 [Mesorhizobium sp.]
MKLQLIGRHIRDDQDFVVSEVNSEVNILILISLMEQKIEEDRPEGSNWRYSIQPTEEAYK